jgi:hypothetical protein
VRSAQTTKSENECDEACAGSERVRKQRDGDISSGETLAHDAGSNYGCEQKGRTKRLRR